MRSAAFVVLLVTSTATADRISVTGSAGSGIADDAYRSRVGWVRSVGMRYAGWPDCCVIAAEWANVEHRSFDQLDRFRLGFGTTHEHLAGDGWRYAFAWTTGVDVHTRTFTPYSPIVPSSQYRQTDLGWYGSVIGTMLLVVNPHVAIGPEVNLSVNAHRANTSSEGRWVHPVGVDLSVGLIVQVTL